MKIALVTDCVSRYAGGMFDAVRRMAQEIQRGGATVEAFGIEDAAGTDDLSLWNPVRSRLVRGRGPRSFGYAPTLAAALQAEKPDVIDSHGLWKFTSIAARRASISLKCPYVVHPHGMLDPWALRNSGWKKKLAAIAYEGTHLQNAACLRALNRSEAESMRAYGLTNPICVIPLGIDLPRRPETEKHEEKSVSHLSGTFSAGQPESSGRRLLLFLGRIHPKKGLVNLLHAWALAKRGRCREGTATDWVLAIAGWEQGDHEAELRRLASQLDLGDSIAFLGPQFGSAKEACLRSCDAFILPSLSEGLPVAVLEAWAHSKPVVMTSACNLPEGFSSDAAIKIESTPEGVAKGLDILFSMTGAQREQIGQRGRRLVEERYSWSRAAEQMGNVFKWLLEHSPAPDCIEFTG